MAVMDFIHDDTGTHRVTGRAPKSVTEDDEDIDLFAVDPDEDEGPLLPDDDDDELEPDPDLEPDADDEEEPEPVAAKARRQNPEVERLVREAQEQREQFNRLQAEIAQERLGKAQAELSAIKSHSAVLARDYEQAKREYQEAIELGETSKISDLQEKLAELHHQRREFGQFMQTRERQLQNPQAFQPAPAPEAPKPNPLAMEWAKRNKWFGDTKNQRHQALTGAAYALDKSLIDEGYNPHTPHFFKELDKRLRETMNAGARPRRQTVAGVSARPAQGPARRGVPKLTGKQKTMAARLGLAESDYAQYVDI